MELAARQAQVDLIFKDTPNDPGTVSQEVQELAKDPRVRPSWDPSAWG